VGKAFSLGICQWQSPGQEAHGVCDPRPFVREFDWGFGFDKLTPRI